MPLYQTTDQTILLATIYSDIKNQFYNGHTSNPSIFWSGFLDQIASRQMFGAWTGFTIEIWFNKHCKYKKLKIINVKIVVVTLDVDN